MAAPDAAAAQRAPKQPPSALKSGYLVLYNLVSAVAWSVVLVRTVTLFSRYGPGAVFFGVGEWTTWTQTMAAMEILHSLFGIVRAPLFTTLMQVSSRFLLVWGIIFPFPFLSQSIFYTTMLIAWSVTEVIRYSYFAVTLAGIHVGPLTWLRYNTFFVLYPVGIISECAIVWLATEPAGKVRQADKFALYAILAIYVPGAYVLYSYMMSQRAKVMRGMKQKNQKATQ